MGNSTHIPSRAHPKGAYNQISGMFNKETGDLKISWMNTTNANRGRGVGSDMMSRAVEALGSKNVRSLSGELGADNFRVYQGHIRNGDSPLQAVMKTPAAKIRQRLGFKNISVTFDAIGRPIITGRR